MFSPADPLPAPPFFVGGRVIASSPREITVADAFASVRVALDEGPSAAVGDLVVAHVVAVGRDARLRVHAIEVVGRDVRAVREGGELARLLARGRASNLRRRAEILASIRSFFGARGFLEVETPIVVPSPGLDLHLDAFALAGPLAGPLEGPLEGTAGYLITSPEYQMKRLLAGGMPRIFQIVRSFRRGEVGANHNPEFTMLEWYRSFCAVETIVDETEALVVEVAQAARGRAEAVVGGRTIALDPPFERLPIARAFARHARVAEEDALALALSDDDADHERFFRTLVDEVEPRLAEGPPVFLTDWPHTMASLARRRTDDPRVAERFELYVGGIELCNGFGELVDPVEQHARLVLDRQARTHAGRPVYPIDERFLRALEEGLPPSAGNALGVDRLIAIVLGAQSIGEVLTFPSGPDGWL